MNVSAHHQKAMSLAEQAVTTFKEGDTKAARQLFRQAYEEEKKAVELVDVDMQPTHSVLCRSAAALARDGGLPEEAQWMVNRGLKGDPPAGAYRELITVLRDIEPTLAENASLISSEGQRWFSSMVASAEREYDFDEAGGGLEGRVADVMSGRASGSST